MTKAQSNKNPERCPWCGNDELYCRYHDQVWGRPETDSQALFAKLCLDGQQAGLSWITILRKQANYEQAFADFDPEILACWGEPEIAKQMQNAGIVRNRLKIESIIRNARAFLSLEEKGQSFNSFLWKYVDGKPLQNQFASMKEVPASTPLSERLSRDLKKQGFNFVGPTIVYAFMQAVGMVNDHLLGCHVRGECEAEGARIRL